MFDPGAIAGILSDTTPGTESLTLYSRTNSSASGLLYYLVGNTWSTTPNGDPFLKILGVRARRRPAKKGDLIVIGATLSEVVEKFKIYDTGLLVTPKYGDVVTDSSGINYHVKLVEPISPHRTYTVTCVKEVKNG